MTELHGVLPVWKPAGWTSHDVVAKVRRIIREKRIGHTGTLDPQVVGVLPLCVGRATRLVEYLQEMPKEYEATLRLGLSTDTEDMSGEVAERADASHVTEAMVKEALLSFIGPIEQVPPMYSAIKVNGKRLYELAREGKTVERKPRQVTIHHIELIGMTLGDPEPEVRFRVRCSKGTYIRTLCVDVGRKLGVPATMAELIRTRSANFGEEDSFTFAQIEEAMEAGTLADLLIPMDRAVSHFPELQVAPAFAPHAVQGKGIPEQGLSALPLTNCIYRLYDEEGTFLGLYHKPDTEQVLRPIKVFVP